jgi:hypothetical protein
LPAGTTLSIISGDTGGGVAGAQVSIGQRQYVSDVAGRMTLQEAAAVNSVVTIADDRFLVRRTVIRSLSAVQVTLWPKSAPGGFDEAFTSAIVYGMRPGVADARFGLFRPTTDHMSIVPDDAIFQDQVAMASHRQAAAQLTEATGGRITFTVDAFPGTSRQVIRSQIDPDAAIAETRVDPLGFVIERASINYERIDQARNFAIVLHELGHVIGLQHTGGVEDIMGPGRVGLSGFSDREKLAIRLILQRPPGTQFPDDDAGVASTGHRQFLAVD